MSRADRLSEFGSSHYAAMIRQDRYGRCSTMLSGPLRRDPIFTPLFTSALLGAGFSSGAAAIGGSVLTAIASTALTVGLQAMMAPKPPTPEDGKAPLTQGLPFRIYAVGETRVAGAKVLWEAKGSNLCIVQALVAHKAHAITRVYFNDDIVEADPVTGKVTPLPNGRYDKGGAWFFTRLGAVPETPYDMVVDLMGDDDVWTDNHRGDGQASLAIVAQNPRAQDFSQSFPYGAPAGSVVGEWAIVFDYRISSDPTNPAAWVFSKNAALIMCWHQCFNPFGHLRSFTRAILPLLDMWIEEADICDEDVALNGGGTEKRYECGGWDTDEFGPKTATNAILAACDGWICDRGDGALLFTVGKFRESRCGTIIDDDVAGHNIHDDILPEDDTNKLIPKFNYPDTDFSTADTDAFEDIGSQTLLGRVLANDMDLRWVQKWRQARRLGLREWKRIQEKVNGELNLRTSGINAVYYRWNRVDAPTMLPRQNGKVLENATSILDLKSGGFTMSVRQHPDDIDAWTPATDEGQQPPVPPKPNASGIVTPVINLIQAKPNGESVYIRVDIVDPDDESLYPVVRYQLADDGSGNPGEWLEKEFPKAEPAGGYYKLNTDVVPSNKLLNVQVAFIGGNRRYGNWTLTQTVTSTVDPVAPAALTAFSQTAAAPHLGNAVFSFATPNDAHIKTVKLYRKATGVPLNVAVDTPISTQTVAASATYPGIVDGDVSRTNIITNGDFPTNLTGWSAGTGWAQNTGTAKKTAGTASTLSQVQTMANGDIMRFSFDLSGRTAGSLTPSLLGSTNVNGTAKSANNTYRERLTANATSTAIRFVADATFDGALDNIIAFKETLTCAPQGVWDYYAVPFNGSDIAGTPSGPVTVTII